MSEITNFGASIDLMKSVESYVLGRLSWWSRVFFWIARRHQRMGRAAVEVWMTGRTKEKVDETTLNDLHNGYWQKYPWMSSLYLALRESGAIGRSASEDPLRVHGTNGTVQNLRR
jgi:hypothetical protein